MRKFLVVLSGAYFILIGIFSGLVTISACLAPQPKIYDSVKIFLGVFSLIFPVIPLLTGIGIILKKHWSRLSVFILSTFAICMGLFSLIVNFFVFMSPNLEHEKKIMVLPLMAFFVIFFILIPVFFIVLFNRNSVKELFIQKGEDETKIKRPMGLTLISVLSFLGSLFCIFLVFLPMPNKFPLIANIMVSEKISRIYCFILASIYLYIGIGLLRQSKVAKLTAVFFNGFLVLMGIIDLLTISKATVSEATSSIKAIYGVTEMSLNMSLASYKIGIALGLIASVAILIYLFSRKE